LIRVPPVRALTVVGAVATLATLVGLVAPSAALADYSPTPLTMMVGAPSSLPYRSAGELTIDLGPDDPTATGELVVEMSPVRGALRQVVLDQAMAASHDPVTVPIVGDVARRYVITFTADDATRWVSPPPQTVLVGIGAAVTTSTLVVMRSPASGAAVRPGPNVWRSFGGVATMTLRDADGAPVASEPVTLQQVLRGSVGTLEVAVGTGVTGPDGTARITVNPWSDTTYRMAYAGSAGRLDPSTSSPKLVRPATPGARVLSPTGSPQPTSVAPPLGHGTGSGANAVISPIPNAVWASMVGYSWSPTAHCPVGRSQLAYILVNYWGFDGNRYRGELVVARNRANAFARAFTALYNANFPIRSMVRPDRWGRSPSGWPGANDYASMAHDNTYAFDCRYVVGRESIRRMSPHAYGYAVDINTWENPDLAADGAHPDSWFLRHRTASYGGVLVKTGIVVRIMRDFGFGWGGTSIGDTQHFDPTLL
jgi:D-alanyl-D-alanine carboxypeptidase